MVCIRSDLQGCSAAMGTTRSGSGFRFCYRINDTAARPNWRPRNPSEQPLRREVLSVAGSPDKAGDVSAMPDVAGPGEPSWKWSNDRNQLLLHLILMLVKVTPSSFMAVGRAGGQDPRRRRSLPGPPEKAGVLYIDENSQIEAYPG